MTSSLSVTLNIHQFFHTSLILSHNCAFLSISVFKATAIISIWTAKPTRLALTPSPASDLYFQWVLQYNQMADFQASPVPKSNLPALWNHLQRLQKYLYQVNTPGILMNKTSRSLLSNCPYQTCPTPNNGNTICLTAHTRFLWVIINSSQPFIHYIPNPNISSSIILLLFFSLYYHSYCFILAALSYCAGFPIHCQSLSHSAFAICFLGLNLIIKNTHGMLVKHKLFS